MPIVRFVTCKNQLAKFSAFTESFSGCHSVGASVFCKQWQQLEDVDTGSVHIVAKWLKLSKDLDEMKRVMHSHWIVLLTVVIPQYSERATVVIRNAKGTRELCLWRAVSGVQWISSYKIICKEDVLRARPPFLSSLSVILSVVVALFVSDVT